MIEKDKEVLQIEEKYKDEFDALYDRIHVEVEQNIAKQAQLRKRRQQLSIRLSSIAVALIFVVTLSIVLPIVLQPEETILRYNDSNIQFETVEYTLKEYAQNTGENILILDWYDTADTCNTKRYFDVNNIDTTVFMQEFFDYEGLSVELSALKNNDKIIVEILETDWSEPDYTTINDITVAYRMMIKSCKLKFEYQGYTYYLNFMDTADWDFITFTIESMFNN